MIRALYNAARTGLAEILAHKTRSVLSFLAIAAGSVVFIDAFAAIVHTYRGIKAQYEFSGVARMRVTKNVGRTISDVDGNTVQKYFTYDDFLLLREKMPGLYMISPETGNWRNLVEYGGRKVYGRVSGVTPEWRKRDFSYDLRGRFLDWRDVDEKLRVCVVVRPSPPPPANAFVKSRMKNYNYTSGFDSLATHADLLGKTIKIDNLNFTVVGVLDEIPSSRLPGRTWSSSGDKRILVPLTTMLHYGLVWGGQSLDVNLDAGQEKDFDEAYKRVNNFLKVRFGDDEYFIVENQMEDIKERAAARISSSLVTISLGMLAFIAGGIGIMNVTLATVFARTKEIGLRRAIGASRGDIMLQFIVEAVMLGLIGGLLGTALGWFWGVPAKVMLGMSPSPIRAWMPLVSVFIAALTSFAFAIYPAWVAAGLKPADALRAE